MLYKLHFAMVAAINNNFGVKSFKVIMEEKYAENSTLRAKAFST